MTPETACSKPNSCHSERSEESRPSRLRGERAVGVVKKGVAP